MTVDAPIRLPSRILLKLSGEALLGEEPYGIDPKVLGRLADEIIEVATRRRPDRRGDRRRQHLPRRRPRRHRHGPRHRRPHGHAGHGDERAGDAGCDREARRLGTGDERDQDQRSVRGLHSPPRHPSSREEPRRPVRGRHRQSVFHHRLGRRLRAVEIGADLLLKGTKVDGVYSADPNKDATATRFDALSYEDVIDAQPGVMDTAAIALCRDHGMPLRIYDMKRPGNLMRIVRGEPIGTLVTRGG